MIDVLPGRILFQREFLLIDSKRGPVVFVRPASAGSTEGKMKLENASQRGGKGSQRRKSSSRDRREREREKESSSFFRPKVSDRDDAPDARALVYANQN